MKEGDVVIVNDTNQAGTLIHSGDNVWVLKANTDLHVGPKHSVRLPSSVEELAACVLEADRFNGR